MGAQVEEVKQQLHEVNAARILSEVALLQKLESTKVEVAQKIENSQAEVLQKVDASLANLGQNVKATCDEMFAKFLSVGPHPGVPP